MTVIPDPLEPEKRAIGPDGELWSPVFWALNAPTDRAPTLAELEAGAKLIGWGGPDAFGSDRP
jgi:hypothetical protein